jgi:hypothetical protein
MSATQKIDATTTQAQSATENESLVAQYNSALSTSQWESTLSGYYLPMDKGGNGRGWNERNPTPGGRR